MIELVRPSVDLADEWWSLVDEFGEETIHGSSYRQLERAELERPDGLEAWTETLASWEHPGPHLPEGRVPAAYRWILEDGRLVGTITVRHELSTGLLDVGGHIGYAVRPSARRRGVATAALRLALDHAARLGIDPVLVTCEEDNVASARTIEACGGRLEDVRGTSRRYWLRTGAVVPPLSSAPLTGRSVRLVPFTTADVAAMVLGRRLPGWAEGYPRTDDCDAARMVQQIDPWSPRHVVRLADGLAVGSIGCFGPPDEDGVVEVGYGLVESARGSGVMTEVLALMCGALESAGARVTARTVPDNVPSHRVLARLGFDRVPSASDSDEAEPGDGGSGDGAGEWLWARAPWHKETHPGTVAPGAAVGRA